MGLSYVGSPTTGFTHNGTSIVCTKPTGVASGDLILMVGMGFLSTETSSNPTGFTLVKDGANFTTLFARLADGTEGSSFSFTFGSNGDGIGMCVAIRGSAATSATAGWFDPATFPAWFDPGTAAATIAVPSITLSGSTDWLLGFYGAVGATSQVIGLPSGFTSRIASFGSGTTAGQDIYGVAGDVQSIASGATGTKTGSCVSANRWGLIVGVIPGSSSVSGSASLSGSGTLTAGGRLAGAVALAGTGTFSATGQLAAAAALAGSGTLSVTGVQDAPVSGLQDSFSANDLATLWPDTFGTVAVSGGQCSVQIDNSYSSGLTSAFIYSLAGSYTFAKITPYIATSTEMDFLVGLNANNAAKWLILGNQIQAGVIQGGTFTASSPVTYSPTAHQWLRVREVSGTLFFDTSPDSVTWTSFYSVTYAIDLTANVGVFIGGGDFGSDPTGTTYVGNVNIAAGVVVMSGTGTLSVGGQFAGAAVLAGLGSLGTSPVRAGALAMTGQGTFGVSGLIIGSPVSLAGLGTLTASPVRPAPAALSGLGTLTASGLFAAGVSLSGLGTLGASLIIGTHATLSGSGTLSAGSQFQGAVVLTGLGTLAAAIRIGTAVALSGSGTLVSAWTASGQGQAGLSGQGTLGVTVGWLASAALSGQGTLTALSRVQAAAVLAGLGTLTAPGTRVFNALAALAGSGTLTASGTSGGQGAAALTGAGTLSASGLLVAGPVHLTGIGALVVAGQVTFHEVVTMGGSGSLGGLPVIPVPAAASLSGAGTLTAIPALAPPTVAYLWLDYQKKLKRAIHLWQFWRECQMTGEQIQTGQAFVRAYEADALADAAYTAWQQASGSGLPIQ